MDRGFQATVQEGTVHGGAKEMDMTYQLKQHKNSTHAHIYKYKYIYIHTYKRNPVKRVV